MSYSRRTQRGGWGLRPPGNRGGFSASRVMLIAGLTGAMGFLGLVLMREVGLSRGRRDVVERWESRARQAAEALRRVWPGQVPAQENPAVARTASPRALSTAYPQVANFGGGGGQLRRPADPRIVVFKSRGKLHLYDGPRLLGEWDITLAGDPIGPKRRAGDARTPEGLFFVCAKSAFTPLHRFLALSYPGITDAERGLAEGLIDWHAASLIRRAILRRQAPPADTALGGGLGLHGLFAPDAPSGPSPAAVGPAATDGGISLANADIEVIFRLVEVGDCVEIRP